MKNIIKKALLFAVMIPSLAIAQEGESTVKFKFDDNQTAGKVFITYNLYGPNIIDSIVVGKPKSEFTIKVNQPTQVTLSYSKDSNANKNTPLEDSRTIYIEQGTAHVHIKNSLKTASITGMPINDKYEHYINHLKPSEELFAEISREYNALTPEQKSDLTYTRPIFDKQDQISILRKELVSQYIVDNPNSLFSLHGLRGIHHLLLPGEFDTLFHTLSDDVRKSSVATLVGEYLKSAKIAGVGVMAPDFTQNDVNGNPVKLSDFRGKYVLLDFWASWCAPCRADNPKLVKAYEQYKDKGFTILGVSLDSQNGKNAWLKAIQDDKLEWINVSDLKGWKNEASNLYMVRAVPQNYLIDPTGKVVAVNLRGYKLEDKLKEIFN